MSRYGIAEWYGHSFLDLLPHDRRRFSEVALTGQAPPPCPFRQMPCNKRGGVCSIQPYEPDGDHISHAVGHPVIVCPVRFEQQQILIRWLAEVVGFSPETTLVAREIPFMLGTKTRKPAGKIDLIAAQDQHVLTWFGLEIQAVYFSGPGMDVEFEALRDRAGVTDRPPFPRRIRRPDWRSSSAKRLAPQLQIKGPTLRRWQSKIAVAVDKPFFASIGGPSDMPSHDLDSGDVIWLVPELSGNRLERGHWEVLTLEASTEKLLSAKAIPRQEFEQALRRKLTPLTETQ